MNELTRQSLVERFENIISDYEQRQLSEIDVEDLNYQDLKCISESLQFAQLKAKKSGEWVSAGNGITARTICSNCRKEKNGLGYTKYCSECGAKMKERENR